MKINIATENNPRKVKREAFTLIEMIGVLAVIAILAALLIPKVFNAINSARINSTAESIQTMKTAVTDHYGKYGALNERFVANALQTLPAPPYTGYDTNVLMVESLLDKPFNVKIGTNWIVQLVTGAQADGGNGGYMLDGTTNTLTTGQAYVVEVEIQGVAAQDAYDLNTLIDGPNLAAANNTTAGDSAGRVEYSIASGTATVYVYLAGR